LCPYCQRIYLGIFNYLAPYFFLSQSRIPGFRRGTARTWVPNRSSLIHPFLSFLGYQKSGTAFCPFVHCCDDEPGARIPSGGSSIPSAVPCVPSGGSLPPSVWLCPSLSNLSAHLSSSRNPWGNIWRELDNKAGQPPGRCHMSTSALPCLRDASVPTKQSSKQEIGMEEEKK
jgi:hypothetical protein